MWYTVLVVVSSAGGTLNSLSVSSMQLPIESCSEIAALQSSMVGTVPGYRSSHVCMELPKLEALIAKHECNMVGNDPSDGDLLYECKSTKRVAAADVSSPRPRVTASRPEPASVASRPGATPTLSAPSDVDWSVEIPAYPLTKGWAIQAASYSSPKLALELADTLKKSGHNAFVMPVKSGSSTLYRVRIGPFDDRAAANGALSSIKGSVSSAALVAHP